MTVIAFISQKRGVGKSTLAQATATEANKQGIKTLLADLDHQQSAVLNELNYKHTKLIGLQISDHIWKKEGRQMINFELIIRLAKKIEIEGPFVPEGRKDDQEFFKYEPAWDNGRSYKLIWYLKDNDNHLWIRTCHPTKKKYNK